MPFKTEILSLLLNTDKNENGVAIFIWNVHGIMNTSDLLQSK